MVVGFYDNRALVKKGQLPPSVCGDFTYSVKNYRIETKSGKPLAEEFTFAVTESLRKNGVDAEPLYIPPGAIPDSAIRAFMSGGRERLLFFLVNEWASSWHPSSVSAIYEVRYDIESRVFDQSGRLLASAFVRDVKKHEHTDIGTVMLLQPPWSIRRMQEFSDSMFRVQIRALFNDENIRSSLH